MLGPTLGHYRIVETIGAGGMGVVYLAHDERLNRNVALKVLHRQADSDQAAHANLIREAQTVSALNHPYICTIHEVGEENGCAYIAMEYIQGQTLESLVSHAPMRPAEIIRYGSQIAEALEHAHAKGIVHRDLKPANVIVTLEDRVKVLDFGLAKRQLADGIEEKTLSQLLVTDEQVAGTLPYMAPEVLRGVPADERADIWALGVMLYEMSAGARPFQNGSPYELTSAILRDDPPPLTPGLPAGLNTVIVRCLAKEPGRRYQRAGEVRAALESVQAGTIAVTPPVPAPGPEPRRMLWTAIALLLALVLAVSLYWFLHLGEPIQSIAILPFSGSSADTEYLSDGITDGLIDSAARLPNVKVISHASAFHYKGKEVDPRSVGHELKVGAVLTGRVLSRGDTVSVSVELVNTSDNTRLWGEQYTRKLTDLVAMQRDISQEIGAELRLHLSGDQRRRLSTPSTENSEAYQLYLRGLYHYYERRPERYEVGWQYCEQAIEKDPAFALAYTCLANYTIQQADDSLRPAREAFPKAKALAKKALSIDPGLGAAHSALGFVAMYYEWDFPGAEREFKRAMELNPSWVQSYHGYSICLRTTGRIDEAVAIDKRGRELDPLSVAINTSLGWTFYYARRYPEAIGQFQTSLAMDPSRLAAQQGLAYAYLQNGMEREAIEAFQNFITASGDTDLASALGRTYSKSGFRTAMLMFWKEVLNINLQNAKRGAPSPFVIAGLYSILGNKNQAFDWLEKAYEARSPKLLDLKVDPDFDNLWRDPRFGELARRIGLP